MKLARRAARRVRAARILTIRLILTSSVLSVACTDAVGPIAPVGSRSVLDRPDDLSGEQIHVVYAVCSIRCSDRGLDTLGLLEESLSVAQNWLQTQTQGLHLRLDTFQGQLDVSFIEVTGDERDLDGRGSALVDYIWDELDRAGFPGGQKKYLIYYDGGNSVKGSAQFNARAAAVYIGDDVSWLRVDSPRAPRPPSIREFGALHEALHTLGAVDSGSPNHDSVLPFHVSDGPLDLMWGAPGWNPSVLDIGGDDYFGDAVPSNVTNLADSPFLTR